MKAKQLRETFTEFFEAREHALIPSSSLIPHDDSLLFTNSGMVPFKSFFLGNETSPFKRATTVQKCVRAGGKHNDLDEVGRTSRHLTFFEMLGNFSFGDYFKDEAIPMAWEFFTEILGLDSERLWVTVHETDDEAADIWETIVGVSPDRIQRLDADNWWRMADTGPNGPCSEIFWDMGPEYGPSGGPANALAEDRYIEIWNLVFMQFDQQTDGTQIPLPNPSIDTGAGLERVLLVLQGVDSVWLTDEFQILLSRVKEICNIVDKDHENFISLQILADHARSTTFLTNDGVVPSNEDRGYVLRRIIRRAVRHAYLLGVNEPVMGRLAEAVVDLMGDAYPELVENSSHIKKILEREEIGFRQTLTTGMAILDGHLLQLESGDSLNGEVAFQLHDTYGFPIELTQEITAEKGITVDQKSFEAAMAEQRDRARKDFSNKEKNQNDNSHFQRILEEHGPSDFVGYEKVRIESRILFVDSNSVILDQTPFYAEAGGQVGDRGIIEGEQGKAEIIDTVYGAVGQHRHIIGSLVGEFQIGEKVVAKIDEVHRLAVQRHHTGTHLLHWALREVLGDHVKQQGSWVGAERLRFDFSHFESMTQEQIREVEDLANEEIFSGAGVAMLETGMTEAKKMGAIAFFGEKYGERVRVLKAGNNSVELCGGTHVKHLSDVGPVKIVTEGSIGSNIRRIEAVAGSASLNLLRDTESILGESADLLGVPSTNMVEALIKRLREMDELQGEINTLRAAATQGYANDLIENAVDGVIVQKISGLRRDELRDLVMNLRSKEEVKVVVLGTVTENGGVSIAAGVSDTEISDAGELLSGASKIIKGGGGKGKDFAMIGGKNAEALSNALEAIRDLLDKA